MVQIHFAGRSQDISDDYYKKLCLLLPYWGLKIDKNNTIQGIGFPSSIGISGLSDASMTELEGLLSHTDINMRRGTPSQFIVTYKHGQSTPLSVRIRSVTYRFRPTLIPKATHLKEHIFKNIWLPMRIPLIHVFMSPEYFNHAPEWMSYLLIQYASTPADFQDLTSMTFEDYHYFTSQFLSKINPKFSAIQQWDEEDREGWPPFPLKPPSFDAFSKPDTNEKEEDEEIEEDGQPTFRPFRINNHTSEPEPINPFKLEPSGHSIINPFRNKNSKD